MAVTQQFARIPAAQLAACRLSVAELDKLCSFESAPRADYLDLNWWPIVLRRLGELPGGEHPDMSVLSRAFDGHDEVNPAYRDHPTTVWEHPVTALEPDVVDAIAAELRTLAPEAVGAAVPLASGQADAGAAQVVQAFVMLRDFYVEAAQRRLAVVLWWD